MGAFGLPGPVGSYVENFLTYPMWSEAIHLTSFRWSTLFEKATDVRDAVKDRFLKVSNMP